MFAFIKAIAATILIAEVAGAFALGLVTMILFTLPLGHRSHHGMFRDLWLRALFPEGTGL